MSAVRHFDTAPEMKLRRALWAEGLRYRVHRRIAHAKPDVAFVAARVAVFVDGCFWHGCPRHYTPPNNNAEFWRQKLESNITRDQRNSRELTEAGWCVLRFWECEVRHELRCVVERVHEAVERRPPLRAV